jgi:hypothetical protein
MSEQRALFFVRKVVGHALHFAHTERISLRLVDGALTVALSERSEWDERHGRLRREVTVERGGSCRDTSGAIRPNEN